MEELWNKLGAWGYAVPILMLLCLNILLFTDIFEKGNFEAIFSHLGMIIGLSISAYILITMAKSFIDLVIKELKN